MSDIDTPIELLERIFVLDENKHLRLKAIYPFPSSINYNYSKILDIDPDLERELVERLEEVDNRE